LVCFENGSEVGLPHSIGSSESLVQVTYLIKLNPERESKRERRM